MAGAGGPRIWAAMVGDVLGVEIPPGGVVVGVWGLARNPPLRAPGGSFASIAATTSSSAPSRL